MELVAESVTVEHVLAIDWTEAIDGTPVPYDDGAAYDHLVSTLTLRCTPSELTTLEAVYQSSPPTLLLEGTGFLLGPALDHSAGLTVTLLDLQIDGPADSAMTLFDATIRVHYGPLSAPSAGSLAVVLGRGVPYHAPAAENAVWATASGAVDSSAFTRRSTRSTRWYCNSLTYAQAADALNALRTLRGSPTIWSATGLGRPFGPGEPQSNTVWIPRWRFFRGSNLTWDIELEVVRNG